MFKRYNTHIGFTCKDESLLLLLPTVALTYCSHGYDFELYLYCDIYGSRYNKLAHNLEIYYKEKTVSRYV